MDSTTLPRGDRSLRNALGRNWLSSDFTRGYLVRELKQKLLNNERECSLISERSVYCTHWANVYFFVCLVVSSVSPVVCLIVCLCVCLSGNQSVSLLKATQAE